MPGEPPDRSDFRGVDSGPRTEWMPVLATLRPGIELLASALRCYPRPILAVLLVVVWGVFGAAPGSAQQARESPEYVHRVVQRMAGRAPDVTTRRRLHAYRKYIRYFANLSYSRPGYTVDEDFVRALIAAESSGRPGAVSDDGAIGLMQIMPETGRRAARQLYASGYDFRHVDRRRLRSLDAEDLRDPAVNILIGCFLLDRYNRQFGGNLARTVGAWNAGPQRIRQYGATPPYEETLELVGRVNAYYLFFRRTTS